MSRIDKINFFNSNVGINDNTTAEHYLYLTGGNAEQAVKLYLSEREVSQNNNRNNSQNNQYKIEFIINYERFLNLNVFNRNDESIYINLIKFLEEKFIYVSNNLENFVKLLKEHAGLMIVLPQDKHFDVRNDMIIAYSDQLCLDIMRNVVILPVMKDSNIGKDLISKCSPRKYPLYLFCKYKNKNVIDINFRIEGNFNTVNAINFFLDCFPESNIKQSLFKSINETMVNIRNSVVNYNNNVNNNVNNNSNNANNNNNSRINNDSSSSKNNILLNSQNYFTGNIDELNELIAKLERNSNNQPNYSINNSQNNNNNSLNNISNNQSQNNNYYNYNNQDFNNSINQSQRSDYNNRSIYQQSFNNYIDNRSQSGNSLIQNNQSLADSIYGLAPGEINAKREREMRELERQHEEKVRKEEEEKRKILKEENEKKARIEKYENEAEFCKQNLTEEPDENDPDICRIKFRYPNGEKSVERRFLKTDTIIILYNFVKSLGREIFFESNSNDFDLICGFPPKNLENSKDKTLEEEGLFPSSLVQINEK